MATYRASIQPHEVDALPMVLEIEADSDALALERAIKCSVDLSRVVGLVRLDWVDVLQGAKLENLAQLHSFRATLTCDLGTRRNIRFVATSPVAAFKYAFEACDNLETVTKLMQSAACGWKTIKFEDM